MGRRQRLGEWGETVAVRYLARRGYEVLRRKWRCAAGEVDIVARHNGVLIFVEVRTRSGNDPGMAAESITAAKRARLITLAGMFLESHHLPADTPWRIDIVAIAAGSYGQAVSIEHIPFAVETT
ncbi:MAG: YraN family protein [Roseiflexus sp.]|nr:YraN family protein [Roseiflexus sp.]MCS7290077.1 YraN family protein [Roseiflexus sp.]MDW8231652.1 YraN family protein [Roseiflexaceae bacterium]